MIVLVQWATTNPTDYIAIDVGQSGAAARRWLNLPKKNVPTDSSTLGASPGWLFDVVIQGVHLYGFDHVAGEPIAGGGLRFYGWVDDTSDPTFQYRWGEVWDFLPTWADRTISYADGSTMRYQGPDQRKTVFAENTADMAKWFPQENAGLVVPLKSWSQWVMPAANIQRHGIWVRSPELFQQHFNVRRQVGWRDWVAG